LASKYKRHSTGGRFKRIDAGDLGSGALKRQSDIITDSLKLQAAQVKEQDRQTVQNVKGIAEVGRWNDEKLSQLEDKIYQNKRDAIKIRRDTEVESLEGKAAELQRKADFWQDFSPTLAKTFIQSATVAKDAIQKASADARFDRLNVSETISDLTTDDLDKSLNKLTLNQSDLFKDDPENLGFLSKLFNGNNRFFRAQVFQEIQDNMPQIEELIRTSIQQQDNPNRQWTYSKVKGYYKEFGESILAVNKISKETKVGRKIIHIFSKYGTLKSRYLKNLDDVETSTGNFKTSAKNFANLVKQESITRLNADGTINELYTSALQNIQNAGKNWTRNSGQGFVTGFQNPMQLNYAVADELAAHFPDVNEFIKHMMNLPQDGDWKKSLNDRYKNPQSKAQLESEFAKIHTTKWKQKHDQNKIQEKANEAKNLSKVKTFINNAQDINTVQERDEAKKLLKELDSNSDAYKELQSLLVLDYSTRSEVAANGMIAQEIENGNIDYLRKTIKSLPKSAQEIYAPRLEALESYNENMTNKDETSTAKAAIKNHLDKNGLDVDNRQMSEATQIYKDVGRNAYVDYYLANPGDKFKLTDALDHVNSIRNGAMDAGVGIWRVTKDRSGKNTLAAFVDETYEFKNGKEINNEWAQGISDTQFEEKLSRGGLSSLFRKTSTGEIEIVDKNIGGGKDEEGSYNIIPVDTTDKWFKNNARGETMSIPDRVEDLYNSQEFTGDNSALMSRRDIMQAIATVQGRSNQGDNLPSIDIQPDQLDKATYSLLDSQIDYGQLNKYSAFDLTTLGVLQSTLGENEPPPMSKSLSDIYTKASALNIDPMLLATDGDPSLINYNYFNVNFNPLAEPELLRKAPSLTGPKLKRDDE